MMAGQGLGHGSVGGVGHGRIGPLRPAARSTYSTTARLTRWQPGEQPPQLEVPCGDRAGPYADGATRGALQVVYRIDERHRRVDILASCLVGFRR